MTRRRVVAGVALVVALAAAEVVGAAIGYRVGREAGYAAGVRDEAAAELCPPSSIPPLPAPTLEVRMLSPERMRAAVEEAARRGRVGAPAAVDVLRGAFPEQRACIVDPAPFKAEFCTRRAAKTYTWGLEAVADSLSHPRARYLFLGLVRDEARSMFWVDVLQDIAAKNPSLGMQFHEARLEVLMPNGATIRIGAADANEQEMRKLLGLKYRKIAIDEAQDWQHTNLGDQAKGEGLVFEVLKPAVADWRGSITLMGTPGRVTKGLFFDVTQRHLPGWSVHTWTTFQNPYMAEKWAAEIADLKVRFPGIEETPGFQRQYLGRWVIDESNLVYRYKAGRNDLVGGLPNLAGGLWHWVLGVDLGYNDDSAFVLSAYHGSSPVLYVVQAYKQKGMDVTAVVEKIRWFGAQQATLGRAPIEAVVIDGSNKQAVAEMQNRHGLSLIPTDKTGKPDFIELMNAEFTTGRVLVDPVACEPLCDEYGGLVWHDKTTKREEHPACPNHAADAALYGWRHTYSYASRPVEAAPQPGTQEWSRAEAAAMLAKARRGVEQAKVAAQEQFGPADDGLLKNPWGEGYDWG